MKKKETHKTNFVESGMELQETLAGLTDLRSLYRTLDGAIQLVRDPKFPGPICGERLAFACCAYTKALLHE